MVGLFVNRKGRARTTSQTSRNRLNSVDSDMVTSEDEHCSLMSPPRSNSMSVAEHFTDITPLTSEEAHSYQELAETNIALGESINVGHFILICCCFTHIWYF